MTALPLNIIQEAKTIASKVSQQLLVWFKNIEFCLCPTVFGASAGVPFMYTTWFNNIPTMCATIKQAFV